MSTFTKGDILRRKLTGPTYHFGLYLGEVHGAPRVFELTTKDDKRAICHVVTLTEFEDGNPSERIRQPTRDEFATMQERCTWLIAHCKENYVGYYLGGGENGWNCEEAAYFVATGKAISTQANAEQATHVHQKWGLRLLGLGAAALVTAGVILARGQAKYSEAVDSAQKALPRPSNDA